MLVPFYRYSLLFLLSIPIFWLIPLNIRFWAEPLARAQGANSVPSFSLINRHDWPHVPPTYRAQNNSGSSLERLNQASSLFTEASKLHRERRYTEAISTLQESIRIEETVGKHHWKVSDGLKLMAEWYQEQGLDTKVKSLLWRSINSREKELEQLGRQPGENHPQLTVRLNDLAALYRKLRLYDKAEPLYLRSLRIMEKEWGEDNIDVGAWLINLAAFYREQGRYTEAEPLLLRSIRIYENSEYSKNSDALYGLAEVYRAQGYAARATEFFRRVADIEEDSFDFYSKSLYRGEYANEVIAPKRTDRILSFHLRDFPDHLPAAHLALTTLLRRKGRLLSSFTESFQGLRQNLNPANQALLDEYLASVAQLSALAVEGQNQRSAQDYQSARKQLEIKIENLRADLIRESADFRGAPQPVTITAVQQYIPKGAALIEFVKYRPFNAKASEQANREIWGPPHYAAYILQADDTIQWVNLGKAAPIDQAVLQFRQSLKAGTSTSNIKPIARKLDQQLMQPIRTILGNTRQLLLSPDSQLSLMPFAALVDQDNKYLLKTYDITYLASGRDLLRLQQPVTAETKLQPPIIIADPDYQSSEALTEIATTLKGQSRSSRDFTFKFGPLPGTKEEATQLQQLLPASTLLMQAQATENILKQVNSPEILHIATHGFFVDTNLETTLNPNDNRASIGVIQKPGTRLRQKSYEQNPLLRSGLAFAGANSRQSGKEDGIFTALEATGLNLNGTQLVVLSACETGLGDIANNDIGAYSEGILGLRRAFAMAGAESQVLSLWKVDDIATKDLMVKYYQRLLNKEGRGQALRQTQLEMVNSQQYAHPFYWAAFIPSGDWRPLK